MKKCLLAFTIALTAALTPFTSFGQTALPEETDVTIPLVLPRRVAVAMTRGELTLAAGSPDTTLDANVWVYWNFQTAKVPADKNHDALLVVFEKDRVKFFKFCASEPIHAFIARQKANAGRPVIAAK